MGNEGMSEITYTVKEILARLEGKIDAYHGEMAARVGSVESEQASLRAYVEAERASLRSYVETESRNTRFLAVIFFLLGGAGGTLISRLIPL